MRRLLWLSLLLAAPLAAQTVPPEAEAIHADVARLAADDLRGREAGTPDFDAAARYVVARMAAAGLRPGAGRGQWLQPVPLALTVATAPPTLVLTRNGSSTALAQGTDVVAVPPPGRRRTALDGRIVFAGLGVVDPTRGRDDFAGLDVKGAIVVLLQSRPDDVPPAVAAHLGNPRQRARLAAARGAKGVLFLAAPALADPAGFAAYAAQQASARRMTWLTPGGTPRDEGAPALGTLSYAGAEKLFAGSALSLPAVLAAEHAGTAIPRGPLPGTLRFAAAARVEKRPSANVVGLLPGSDPALAGEYVVMSAHLDHLGMVTGADGATHVAHGVQDNAIGVALMLDVARRFQAERIRPRRPILFVALTGEEKGLLGSDYFATRPPVPRGAIVADLNLDMPVLLAPLRDVVAHGGDRSSLGPIVAAAAADVGLTVAPDWEPEQGRFARSDQYSFAIHGIPAVSLKAGPAGGSDTVQRDFARTRYHTPEDDLAHPVEWTAAPLFARLNAAILRRIADADRRPHWNPGDVFGAGVR
ncbi:aminopeptidase [Sphingomonas metalli]|uniref:Aminopeptidase n=1 Tax=Sphingomonas metalli TaxID=1779358 RepID=A0A916WVU5_9SPHN|nr:M28 family peptidase [Sphingomonas metalli]GGB38107.1 aminopeptidase [Sphingomonas metalli]